MSKWVVYDAVSGDVLADGTERQVHRYVAAEDEAAEGKHTLVAASEAEWQRASKVIASRMSGNPPRRNPPSIEHL
jgi:hypothetical protein